MARQRVSTSFWLVLADLGIMRTRVEERLKRNRLRSTLQSYENPGPPAEPHAGAFDGRDLPVSGIGAKTRNTELTGERGAYRRGGQPPSACRP